METIKLVNAEGISRLSGDDENGNKWVDPVALTNHGDNDDYPCLFHAPDGARILVWNRYKGAMGRETGLHIRSKRSPDGVNWYSEKTITKAEGNYKDFWPTVFADRGTLMVLFTSNRPDVYGDLVSTPLEDPGEMGYLTNDKTRPDYFGRVVNADAGHLMVWVGDPGNKDIYMRHVRRK